MIPDWGSALQPSARVHQHKKQYTCGTWGSEPPFTGEMNFKNFYILHTFHLWSQSYICTGLISISNFLMGLIGHKITASPCFSLCHNADQCWWFISFPSPGHGSLTPLSVSLTSEYLCHIRHQTPGPTSHNLGTKQQRNELFHDSLHMNI